MELAGIVAGTVAVAGMLFGRRIVRAVLGRFFKAARQIGTSEHHQLIVGEARSHGCRDCGSLPGAPCMAPTGQPMPDVVHEARWHARAQTLSERDRSIIARRCKHCFSQTWQPCTDEEGFALSVFHQARVRATYEAGALPPEGRQLRKTG